MKIFKKFQNLTKNIFFENSNPLDQKVEIARFIRCSISFLVLQKIVMYIQVLVLTYSRMLSQRIRSKVKTRLRYYFFCWKSKYPCSQVSQAGQVHKLWSITAGKGANNSKLKVFSELYSQVCQVISVFYSNVELGSIRITL